VFAAIIQPVTVTRTAKVPSGVDGYNLNVGYDLPDKRNRNNRYCFFATILKFPFAMFSDIMD
jgi:hypothetical protein